MNLRIQILVLPTLAVITCSLCFGTGPAENWSDRFGGAPLSVRIHSGGTILDADLLGLGGGEMVLRPGDAVDPEERVYYPLDPIPEIRIAYNPPPALAKALERLREQPTPVDLDALRSTAWTLAPYLVLSEAHINAHPLVSRYLAALIRLNHLKEAYALSLEIPLETAGTDINRHVATLTEKLVRTGENRKGLTLLGRLSLEEGDPTALRLFMQCAGNLRSRDAFDEALVLYNRIRSHPDADYKREAVLWAAYCNMRMGRKETARILQETAGTIRPQDPEFSLRQMVLARMSMEDGLLRQAMKQVSHGVAFSRIGDAWVPELLYLNGRIYEKLKIPHAAASAYRQLRLFYPAEPWSDRARERLDILTDPGHEPPD